jgi:mannitol-1-/sugar-/sorbitol-6-/2-deoxyglucose-6-phosphatase
MDGLLIDTEPVWRDAQKEVFAGLGVELTEADLFAGTGVRVDGVPEAIALFRRAGLRLATASSSPLRLIDAVCDRLGLDIGIRCSALDEPHGKPAPDVYLAAARRLVLPSMTELDEPTLRRLMT